MSSFEYAKKWRCALLVGACAGLAGLSGCGGLEADPEDSQTAKATEEADQGDGQQTALDTTVTSSESLSASKCPYVDVGYTIKSGHYIKGSGSSPCGKIEITMQRLRWFGWEIVRTAYSNGPATSVVFDCEGSGTYTYRTEVVYRGGGTRIQPRKLSNLLRVNC